MKRLLKKTAVALAVAAFWLLLWQLIAAGVDQELLVPTPAATLGVLGALLADASFWKSVLFSLLRVGEGFVCGVAAGTAVAALSHFCRATAPFLKPLMTVVKATPVASFIVLALVWIENDRVPVFISFLMVTPIVWANVREGLSAADPALREVCRVYAFRPAMVARHLYLPAVRPYFFAALNTSVGLAWKAGIAAEVLCRPTDSVGGAIWRAKILLETPSVFAWTAVVVVLSLILEELLAAGIRYLSGKGRKEGSA